MQLKWAIIACDHFFVFVCVTPNHFSQSNSVRYDTPPLYSSVCTAAMFDISARPAVPPSQHDSKTMYRACFPTVPCIPHMHAPLPGKGPPWASVHLRTAME